MSVFPTDVLYAIFDQRYLTVVALPSTAERVGKLLSFDAEGNLTVVPVPAATIVYSNSATPQDVVIGSDATTGDTTINLVAANNPDAKPTVFYKKDATANIVSVVDANGVTFIIDIQYQAIRLVPLPDENIWVKQG